jgi:hypothetical protein
MPSRFACVALLLYWLVSAVGLARRDLLPELTVGSPPDLRTISSAGEHDGPARWSIQVVDNPAHPSDRRSVGQAVTESRRGRDGWVAMSSRVTFDSGWLLASLFHRNTFGQGEAEPIEFTSDYHVDPSGNLRAFNAQVRTPGRGGTLWRIDGHMKKGGMQVVSEGPLPIMNRTVTLDYQPRGVVQSQFGPLDRLPGLQVGQRWDEQVASPFTSQVEPVRAEVKRRQVIYWDKGPVETLEVVHQSKAVSARTWVRPDGLVLRQEVVLPVMRLVLERMPDRAAALEPEVRGETRRAETR